MALFCLLAILDSAFAGFLAGMSHRDTGISLGTFPTPWFALNRSSRCLLFDYSGGGGWLFFGLRMFCCSVDDFFSLQLFAWVVKIIL